MKRRDLACALGLGLTGLSAATRTWAQAGGWPSRPVRWVIPYPAGGPVDAVGRKLAEAMGSRLGQPVVIDNKGGANGSLGTGEVARAAPDGHTFLLTITDTLVNNAVLFRQLGYDPRKDFELLSQVGASPVVMMANADVPARNVAELAALAGRPGSQLSYGSWGPGSFAHLLAEGLKSRLKIEMVHAPYRGAAPAIQDLAAKQISVSFGPVNLAAQLIQRGMVKALAVTGDAPVAQLPGVQTFAAQGLGDPLFRTRLWMGLAAPKGLPPEIARRMVGELQAVLKQPEIASFIQGVGFEVIGSGPEQFANVFAADFPVITRMIQDLKVELQ
jgi:tripartite-type tricarboxylate transporter receptor subunit TctC